jgi:hypothetical protein
MFQGPAGSALQAASAAGAACCHAMPQQIRGSTDGSLLPLPVALFSGWPGIHPLLCTCTPGCTTTTTLLQLSFGPISWLLVGEVFPLKVRQASAC